MAKTGGRRVGGPALAGRQPRDRLKPGLKPRRPTKRSHPPGGGWPGKGFGGGTQTGVRKVTNDASRSGETVGSAGGSRSPRRRPVSPSRSGGGGRPGALTINLGEGNRETEGVNAVAVPNSETAGRSRLQVIV